MIASTCEYIHFDSVNYFYIYYGLEYTYKKDILFRACNIILKSYIVIIVNVSTVYKITAVFMITEQKYIQMP